MALFLTRLTLVTHLGWYFSALLHCFGSIIGSLHVSSCACSRANSSVSPAELITDPGCVSVRKILYHLFSFVFSNDNSTIIYFSILSSLSLKHWKIKLNLNDAISSTRQNKNNCPVNTPHFLCTVCPIINAAMHKCVNVVKHLCCWVKPCISSMSLSANKDKKQLYF